LISVGVFGSSLPREGSLAYEEAREANAWIFLPRGLGTMLELVWMAESVVKADAAPRPFVLLGDFWRPTIETALADASPEEKASESFASDPAGRAFGRLEHSRMPSP
jgi:hypothetical protein